MIAFFAKHPTAANLLMLALIALGITALPQMKRETFPEYSPSKVQVSVAYPGASAEEVEQAICTQMEEAADGVSNVAQMSCESREGMGMMTVEMVEGGDIARVLSDLKTEIDAIDNFPQEAESPVLKELGRNDPLITLAISAELPETELKAYAEDIKDQLQQLPGISLVDIIGFSEHQLRVELSLALLRQYALSVSDVVSRIEKQNIKLPGGNLESRGKTTLLRFDQQQVTADHLANMVIGSAPDGGEIRIKHIGVVTERFEKPESKVLVNDKPAALLKIKKNKEQDSLDLVEGIYQFVVQKQSRLPEGMHMVLMDDSAKQVEARLSMLTSNSVQGLLLVFATMWMFFAWRYSFWVCMGLPVAFMGGFWLMVQMGISINMISMVSLLIAIGILMDDAIVIAESIAAKVESGRPVTEGVIEGAATVVPGIFSSILTTASIFIGLAFISGDIGQVMSVFPVVLLAVLLVSLIEAFLILPAHLLHSLESSETEFVPGFKQRFQHRFEQFRNVTLMAWVEKFVTYRYLTVGATVATLLLSFSLFAGGLLKFKAFPALEGNTLEMRLLLPQGTPLQVTEQITREASEQLQQINQQLTPEQPEQMPLIKNISVEFVNADANEDGPHLSTIRADLLDADVRNTTLGELKSLWRDAVGEIPGAVALSFKEPNFGPAGRPIEIRLHGNDLNMLSRASYQIQQALNRYDGVFDVMDDFRPGKQEWTIKLLPGATAFNVDGATIANQIRAAYFGQVADEVQRNNETIEIDVRLNPEDRRSFRQLQNYPIVLQDGTQIPLSSVAQLQPDRGYSRINRVDGQRTITIIGDIDPNKANTGEIIKEVQTTVIADLMLQYPDLSISYQGEVKEGGETSRSILQKFVMGLLGVFIILSFQFRSYFEPLMVMLAIPLALIGSMWGHLVLGYDFTIPSMIGFVSLAGIVVNDSILLVAALKSYRQQGKTIHESAVLASKSRFRAVFITSATTIAGMLPLLLETSLQAQLLQPLVVSVTFGIASSTLLILFVLPCFYCILEDHELTTAHHKSVKDAEPVAN